MDEMKTYNRRSIRLKDYDYSQKGVYFVTICLDDKKCLLGNVGAIPCNRPIIEKIAKKGENMVSPVHMMIDKWWQKMFEKYGDEIEKDEYIIMPNLADKEE